MEPLTDPLAALEALVAAHDQQAELESRLTRLGGRLQTDADFELWVKTCAGLGIDWRRCRSSVTPSLYSGRL